MLASLIRIFIVYRDKIVTEAQERLLGPDGSLHPAEYTVTELALVETTNEDPTKVRKISVVTA